MAVSTVTVSQFGIFSQLEGYCLSQLWVLLSLIFTRKPRPNASPAHLCHIRHLYELGPCTHINMMACRFVLSMFTDHLSRSGSRRKRTCRSEEFFVFGQMAHVPWKHDQNLSSVFVEWKFWKVYPSLAKLSSAVLKKKRQTLPFTFH